MNSADKLKDTGDGKLLGMEKTILKKDGTSTWLNSDARDDLKNPGGEKIPLDLEMGTGQLNVKRAIDQFKSGKVAVPAAGGSVPVVGWDYTTAPAVGAFKKYPISGFLLGGSYISITLTWDRVVKDASGDNKWTRGEQLNASPLTNLDLFLMPKGKNDVKDAVWSSISTEQNTEHIFFKLPDKAAEYELWVKRAGATDISYALAWWAAAGTAPAAKPGKVKGLAWADADADGVRTSTEAPVADARVDLFDTAGNWISTTTTDTDGSYEFLDVENGSYRVEIAAPVGYHLSPQDAGSDDALDSDFDPLTSQTDIITVADDEHLNIDAGLVAHPAASLGDLVWLDLDRDGLRDSGETGVANVAVYLHEPDGDLVDVTTTDADGAYSFAAVRPGSYYLRLEAPYDHYFTAANVGADDALDSDIDPQTGETAVFTVSSGQALTTMDAGLQTLQYATVGNRVWADTDADGVQGAGETGLPGVVVELDDVERDPFDWTTTDAAGAYVFNDVRPGDYYAVFFTPPGYSFAPADQGGDDAADSDADAFGATAVFTVTSAGLTTIDAGLVADPAPPGGWAEVSDFVWEDADGDGIQGASEFGVASVVVRLYTAAGELEGTTTTDATGHYLFAHVAPGDYYVHFEAASYDFSPQDQGGDDTADSDADAAGRTEVFTIAAATTITSIDAGVVTRLDADIPTIGDFVWDDLDGDGVQDAGEPGVFGVWVDLLDAAGNVIDTTTTNPDGYYAFYHVPGGDYTLKYLPPAGYLYTLQDQGSDATDSDVNPNTGQTALFSFSGAGTSSQHDAGLIASTAVPSVGGRVWQDIGTANGIQDAGEIGLVDCLVLLLDAQGQLIASTWTTADGSYLFLSVPPGTYTIQVVPPEGFAGYFSPKDQGNDDSVDSDVNADGTTDLLTLLPTDTFRDLDAGLVPLLVDEPPG